MISKLAPHGPRTMAWLGIRKNRLVVLIILLAVVFSGWRLCDLNQKASIRFLRITMSSTVSGFSQIFYDLGGGLHEAHSSIVRVQGDHAFHEYKYPIPSQAINYFRFDPLTDEGSVTIRRLEVCDWQEKVISSYPLSILKPLNQIRAFAMEGENLNIAMGADDPQIAIVLNEPLSEMGKKGKWTVSLLLRIFLEMAVILAATLLLILWIGRRPHLMHGLCNRFHLRKRTTWKIGNAFFVTTVFFMSVAFVFFLLTGLDGPLKPVYNGDPGVFEHVAKFPLFSWGFWAGIRPWTVPLLHKIALLDIQRVVYYQLALWIFSHIFLAATMAWTVRPKLFGILAAAMVYVYATSPSIVPWNTIIRSEAVSFSLTSLTIASLILFLWSDASAPKRPLIYLICSGFFLLTAILLAASRDNWAYHLPVMAFLLVLAFVMRRTKDASGWRRIVRWSVPVVLIISFFFLTGLSQKGDRWRFCLTNVIFQRVLTSDEVRQRWHRDYAMPATADVLKFSGQWAMDYNWEIFRNRVFQDWLTERGLKSYARDIITHPGSAIQGIRGWLPMIVNVNPRYFEGKGFDPIIFMEIKHIEWLFFFLVLLPLVCVAISSPPLSCVAMALSIFALGMPVQAAVIVLADAMEVPRHGLAVLITLRLLIILLVPVIIANLYRIFRKMVLEETDFRRKDIVYDDKKYNCN